MNKILIVEDDDTILLGLKDDLEFEGYEVAVADNGRDGYMLAKNEAFNLIILDILLPELTGFEICKKLREEQVKTPILMLTAAKTEEMDKVMGLEMGADDYVTKPVGSREMVARVKAILRRAGGEKKTGDIFKFGDVLVDFKRHEVLKAGEKVHLTALEFKLLKFFIERKGEVVRRDDLLDEAWGDAIISPRTIDSHIVHLRKKIEPDPSRPKYLVSVRGVGHIFEG
ncbi:response regulator transcription factor [Acidobacteriota bacterium]